MGLLLPYFFPGVTEATGSGRRGRSFPGIKLSRGAMTLPMWGMPHR